MANKFTRSKQATNVRRQKLNFYRSWEKTPNMMFNLFIALTFIFFQGPIGDRGNHGSPGFEGPEVSETCSNQTIPNLTFNPIL